MYNLDLAAVYFRFIIHTGEITKRIINLSYRILLLWISLTLRNKFQNIQVQFRTLMSLKSIKII